MLPHELDLPGDWPDEARNVVAAYRKAMIAVGQLTRWVGWLEGPEPHRHAVAAKDMRTIRRIAQEVTGMNFEEYT